MSLDLQALRGLIGAAEVSVEDARAILDETQVTVEDLEGEQLRPLWAIVESRIRNHQGIDPVAIRHALRALPPKALDSSMEALLSPEYGVARERLALVRDGATRRRLIEQLRAIAGAAKSGKPLAEVEAMLRQAPDALQGIQTRVRNCQGDPVAMMDHLEARWRGDGPKSLTTGLGELDDVLGGLINNLIVIGARPGVGKSAMVAGLVNQWVQAGQKVGVLCYEDDARDMQARLVACKAGVSVKHSRGDLLPNEEQRTAISDAFAWWHRLAGQVEVDDARPAGSVTDVLASMRAMVKRGCRVILLDNMTCVSLAQSPEPEHHLRIEAALRDIRSEAQHLRVPAIVIGHLRRGQGDSDTTAPRLSDFAAASAWENYARVALGMWRTASGEVRLRVLKQTNGPSGQDFEVDMAQEAAVVTGTRLMTSAPPPARASGTRAYKRRSTAEEETPHE